MAVLFACVCGACVSGGDTTTCAAMESCNSRDDGCDGETDENFPELGSECVVGVGSCVVTGFLICGPSGEVSCTAVPGNPSPETCNSRDDDCDGETDEDLTDIRIGLDASICDPTVLACVHGTIAVTQEGTPPAPETCDGVDNDCDSETDEDLADAISGMSVGRCAMRIERCQKGMWEAITAGRDPEDESCNGLDDDCDGATDELLPPVITGLATGECRPTIMECMDGGYAVVVAGTEAVGERCDGRDNDCDGETDEDFPELGSDCTVGIGACAMDGVIACASDGTTCNATPAPPTIERCDGDDNDCDSETDEDFPELGSDCTAGVGACALSGEFRCRADSFGVACDAIPGNPAREVCNGVDDDCDGQVDDGLASACCIPGVTRPCGFDVGACTSGVQQCRADRVWGGCDGQVPIRESCNGLDDDCDSETDEDLTVVDGIGIGACVPRITACMDRMLVNLQDRHDPTDEACNGLDDDCDGETDEDDPDCCTPGAFRACGFDLGACVSGVQECEPYRVWGPCPGTVPTDERCNGRDDDCDGRTDDPWRSLLGNDCTSGIGICTRTGTYTCAVDESGAVCDATPGAPEVETCNGLDDDCDGWADEADDLPPRAEGSSIGQCIPRTLACRDGQYVEVAHGRAPLDELCNGLDDDCDGETDDGIPTFPCYEGPIGTEGVGSCAAGTAVCSGARFSCIGPALPSPETCNGLDDDCDGVTDGSLDDGIAVVLTQPCYRGPSATLGIGSCHAGTTTCTSGILGGCIGDVVPAAEICGDTEDTDCDGRDDGMTFLEDFEDDCAVPEAIVTSDVPLECVETPVDSVDHSRMLAGNWSLRATLAHGDGDLGMQLDWPFSTCDLAVSGRLALYMVTTDRLVQVGFNPLFSDERSYFVYRPNGTDDVAVTRNDGITTYDTVAVVIGLSGWYELHWSFAATGEVVYAIDGTTFYSNTLDTAVVGMQFFARSFSGANVQLYIDDVRFSSP